MADAYIQVAPDSTGKKMQTFRNTIAGSDVDAEAVVLTDSTGIALGTSGGALNVSLANAVINANINTALLATSAHQTAGDQKTQIVDGLGNVIGSTSNALNVYLGSITANAGTNLNTVGLATAAAQTNGGQKTLVVDPINASNAAGVTNGALNVYLPSVTANAGTNLNTVGLALAVTQTNGGQKTQIVDPINSSNVAGITNGALNVYLPSITANAGASLNTALLATSANLTSGTQKTQIVDPINASNVAGITNGALNVYLPSITANAGLNLNTSLLAQDAHLSDGSQKTQIIDPSNASNSAGIVGGIGGALQVSLDKIAGVNAAWVTPAVGAGGTRWPKVAIGTTSGGNMTTTAGTALDVSPQKRDSSTSLSPFFFAQRISARQNTFPTNTTCYVSAIKVAITNGVAGATLNINDESGSGNRTLLTMPNMAAVALSAPFLGNYLESFSEPMKMTNGINISTGGSPFGDCNVFISYWQ
jgi:hypothetical protein